MVSISFGTALVAGKNRVPRPATGRIALRIGLTITSVSWIKWFKKGQADGFAVHGAVSRYLPTSFAKNEATERLVAELPIRSMTETACVSQGA
ncbi:hypothetical protein [Pannonibacter carbonis]|uniref:hypothetical protein n=1 Tax=Pannonibacter carbonis TaxID=2067569 RepID=UPI0018E50604|nr:hypothetical protein [Pannonibacter carbonis]